jgi:Tol biopolymer transport system component
MLRPGDLILIKRMDCDTREIFHELTSLVIEGEMCVSRWKQRGRSYSSLRKLSWRTEASLINEFARFDSEGGSRTEIFVIRGERESRAPLR